jgi:hypothetical protein
VLPLSECRGVERKSGTIAGSAGEVERRPELGPYERPGLPGIAEVEGDFLEPPLVAYEDVDLAFDRAAIKPHRTRPIWVRADDEA